jgi:hypothetical protein
MKYFLLEFDKASHEIVRLREYDNSSEAVHIRFELELENPGDDREIVVLGATSLEALENTHSRYFKDGQQLASA